MISQGNHSPFPVQKQEPPIEQLHTALQLDTRAILVFLSLENCRQFHTYFITSEGKPAGPVKELCKLTMFFRLQIGNFTANYFSGRTPLRQRKPHNLMGLQSK